MAKDIVPELLELIQNDFVARYDGNRRIQELISKIRSGKGTYKEAHEYARLVGETLAGVFKDDISSEVLPDGRMYYNIADRVVGERLENNFKLVVDVSRQAQQNLNETAGIKIRAITPELNRNRIQGILDRLDREPEFDKVKWILDAPVTNFTQAAVDETIHVNADLHLRAGLGPKIRRIAVGKTCEWCRALEGVWNYFEVRNTGNPVFQRHQNCNCLILYDPSAGKAIQDVHSKQLYTSKDDVLNAIREKESELARKEKYRRGIKRGKESAEKYAQNWAHESLRNTIQKFAPDAVITTSDSGKRIYTSKDGRYQVLYDLGGDYFRILDNNQTGREYVDINGNSMNNITENGKTRGLSKEEYRRLTHFKNTDSE